MNVKQGHVLYTFNKYFFSSNKYLSSIHQSTVQSITFIIITQELMIWKDIYIRELQINF